MFLNLEIALLDFLESLPNITVLVKKSSGMSEQKETEY